MSPLRNIRPYLFCLACSAVVLLMAAGCSSVKSPAPAPDASGTSAPPATLPVSDAAVSAAAMKAAFPDGLLPDAKGYVGDAACRDCHAQDFKDHHDSNHAVTLHPMRPNSLGRAAPPLGRLPDAPFEVKAVDNAYYLVSTGKQPYAQKLDYAFGTGKHGITYVGILSATSLFEMHASYFPRDHQWRITPGQRKLAPTEMGLDYQEIIARRCMGCHTTTLPADKITPEPRFEGVGCEACHGPAGAHVVAMRTGQGLTANGGIGIDRLRDWGAKRQNEMCGRCHRTGADVKSVHPDLDKTARFQPYGLMLSRCFKESNNTLSCATCHNPHQNTAHDVKTYEAKCLSCHSGKQKREGEGADPQHGALSINHQLSTGRPLTDINSKPCPVNPRTGCIGCHMPTRVLIPNTSITTRAADHYIRVYR